MSFEKAFNIEKDNPKVLANVGMLEARLGRHTEAAQWLRKASAADPSSVEIWAALAESLLQSATPIAVATNEEALGAAQHAARLAPSRAESHMALGRALVAVRRIADAKAELKIALELRPSYGEAKDLMDSLEVQLARAHMELIKSYAGSLRR